MNTFTIFLVLITIVALLLVAVIMVQNPKGGGLDSSLGGGMNVGGVQNTNKFLDNSTWTLAAILLGLILFSSLSFNGGGERSKLQGGNTPQTQAPVTPASNGTEQQPATQKQATQNPVETLTNQGQ